MIYENLSLPEVLIYGAILCTILGIAAHESRDED